MTIAFKAPATSANFNAAFLSKLLVYQKIVGSASGCTHSTIQAALDDASAGDRILVLDSFDVGTTLVIDIDNLLIESGSGVSLTDDGAGTCFNIQAEGIRINGFRFVDFTTAIDIDSTYQYNFITGCRFNNVTNEVVEDDAAPNNVIMGNITE